MNKISLIIKREYLTRVRKKSFIIMSILGPILFAALMVVPAWLTMMEDKDVKKVAVLDHSMVLTEYKEGNPVSVIPDKEYLKFIALEDVDIKDLKDNFESTGYYAVLYIPENIFSSEKAMLYSNKQPSIDVSEYIEGVLEKEIEGLKLAANKIENLEEILREIETDINVSSIKWTKDGEDKESRTEVVMIIGYAAGLLIYMFIFLYGSMVMRGVIEEKTSRIVEVIVSSVKPFQLMMGKIVGVGLVALTQFLIWVALTLVLITVAGTYLGTQVDPATMTQQGTAGTELFSESVQPAGMDEISNTDGSFLTEITGTFESVNMARVAIAFVFFFIFGYLMYGALFAIVGSAVDNETETQQFMLPITIPLILGILVIANVMSQPDGAIAFWFSMIPLTSPVVMMVRMPFDVPTWQLILSGGILILTIIGAVWMAGKIYRTGILMYGKKVSYKELWKWLKYKN